MQETPPASDMGIWAGTPAAAAHLLHALRLAPGGAGRLLAAHMIRVATLQQIVVACACGHSGNGSILLCARLCRQRAGTHMYIPLYISAERKPETNGGGAGRQQ